MLLRLDTADLLPVDIADDETQELVLGHKSLWHRSKSYTALQ